MQKIYGLCSIGGFLATMLVFAILGLEATKLDLTLLFLAWLLLEGMIVGVQKLLRHLFKTEHGQV